MVPCYFASKMKPRQFRQKWWARGSPVSPYLSSSLLPFCDDNFQILTIRCQPARGCVACPSSLGFMLLQCKYWMATWSYHLSSSRSAGSPATVLRCANWRVTEGLGGMCPVATESAGQAFSNRDAAAGMLRMPKVWAAQCVLGLQVSTVTPAPWGKSFISCPSQQTWTNFWTPFSGSAW